MEPLERLLLLWWRPWHAWLMICTFELIMVFIALSCPDLPLCLLVWAP